MIERYTRQSMGRLWDTEYRFSCLMRVEVAVAKAQGELNLIPKEAAAAIIKKAKFNTKEILDIEKTTKHDVIAFVTNVASNVGEFGPYVHYGLTSSDVLDTALSLQIHDASLELIETLETLEKSLTSLASEHADTVCVGRTHGIHAEPTTFGLKVAGFVAELQRNIWRFKLASDQICRVKLSGAVGTYSTMGMALEAKVAADLKLPVEDVATQVIPRDRHAELIWSLSMLAAGFERFAVEIRHLQRTEVDEVEEGFQKGQKGSSAMPHKKNPIASENISGLSRLVRGYLISAMEDIALWHERDISHSSVERIIFPDSFILVDYMAHRLTQVTELLVVKEDKMLSNLELTGGKVFSSHVLLALIKKGMKRESAYKKIQSISHSIKPGGSMKKELLKSPDIKKLISEKEMEDIFSGRKHQAEIKKIINRVL